MLDKLLSRISFIYNFLIFLFTNKYVNDFNIKNYLRVGNGLSNSLIYKNRYVIKIKNSIRESTNRKVYNGSYDGCFFYDTVNKFKNEYDTLEKLYNMQLAPKPLYYNNNYLIIEYLDDTKTIAEYIESNDDLNIFYELFNKINIIHTNDVFHGDLNLNNILIDNKRNIYFIDFESSFLESMPFKEKEELEFKIFEEKMQRFYPKIYREYDARIRKCY